jgi:hypothetical protein
MARPRSYVIPDTSTIATEVPCSKSTSRPHGGPVIPVGPLWIPLGSSSRSPQKRIGLLACAVCFQRDRVSEEGEEWVIPFFDRRCTAGLAILFKARHGPFERSVSRHKVACETFLQIYCINTHDSIYRVRRHFQHKPYRGWQSDEERLVCGCYR